MVYKLELGTVAWVAWPGVWDFKSEGVDGFGHYSINLTSDHTVTYGCVCDRVGRIFLPLRCPGHLHIFSEVPGSKSGHLQAYWLGSGHPQAYWLIQDLFDVL